MFTAALKYNNCILYLLWKSKYSNAIKTRGFEKVTVNILSIMSTTFCR